MKHSTKYHWWFSHHGCKLNFLLLLFILTNAKDHFVAGQTPGGEVDVSTTSSTTDTLQCTDGISDSGRQLMQNVDAVFRKDTHNHLDLAIIIDRSKSITIEGFQYTVKVMQDLLDYVIRKNFLYIHPEFDRVSIYSFGTQSTAELNGEYL